MREKVHIAVRRKFRKFNSFQKNVQEKSSPHILFEGSHVMREKVHLDQKKKFTVSYEKKFTYWRKKFTKKVDFMLRLKVHLSYARRFTWFRKKVHGQLRKKFTYWKKSSPKKSTSCSVWMFTCHTREGSLGSEKKFTGSCDKKFTY